MKVIVVEDAGIITVRDIPPPQPKGPYDALVKMICGSICNHTDYVIAQRQFDWVTDYPTILGHEVVGRIVETGAKARNLKVGDLVSRPHACPPPETGLFESWGGFAEYGLVTDHMAMVEDGLAEGVTDQLSAPGNLDPVAYSQMITLRETMAFLRSLGVQAGQSIVIFGTGPVGLSFSMLARQIGLSPVIVVGRRAAALQRALNFGRATHVIDNSRENIPETVHQITNREGCDWAIEAIGADAVMQDAINSLNESGQVGLYGVTSIGDGASPLRRSERIKHVSFKEASAHEVIMDWVSHSLIPAREFVSHELAMNEIKHGFEMLESKEAFKVLLWMNRE